MFTKLVALTSFGAGYVLGAKAGQERYEQIRSAALRVKNDPRVQQKAHDAAEAAKAQAPVAREKLHDAAGKVQEKVTHHGGAHTETTTQYTPYQGNGVRS